MRTRRLILRAYAVLLVLGGLTAGLRFGLVYAGVHFSAAGSGSESGLDRDINAALLGAGMLFGACVLASLVMLLVEIADSLRLLVWHGEGELDGGGSEHPSAAPLNVSPAGAPGSG
jgi:hypothetical protein